MSESITKEAPALKTKATSQKTSKALLSFKEALFEDMTSKEALQVFDKMTYDILGSEYADDLMYRNEIIVLQRLIHKALVGIDKNISPNDIHVLQITVEY